MADFAQADRTSVLDQECALQVMHVMLECIT
jgi:hypothetical protein